MKLKSKTQNIPWPGIGLVFGGAVGALLGQSFSPQLFAVFCGGGAGLGLILGAIIDGFVRAERNDE